MIYRGFTGAGLTADAVRANDGLDVEATVVLSKSNSLSRGYVRGKTTTEAYSPGDGVGLGSNESGSSEEAKGSGSELVEHGGR